MEYLNTKLSTKTDYLAQYHERKSNATLSNFNMLASLNGFLANENTNINLVRVSITDALQW